MTDQTLNHPVEITVTPIKNLLLRLVAHFTPANNAASSPDTSSSSDASHVRGLPMSRRRRQDIGLSEEYSHHDTRNDVASIAARYGMPI